jgi:hypothetical protein
MAYLNGEKLWRGGKVDTIFIEAALPEMQPWTDFGEGLFARLRQTDTLLLNNDLDAFRRKYFQEFFRDWVSIRVSYGHCYGVTKSKPEYLRKWGIRADRQDSAVFDKFTIGTVASGLRSVYVPKVPGKFATYIECPEYGDSLRRCLGTTDYDALVAFQYYFSEGRLDEYMRIEDEVRGLLASFIKKSVPTTSMPVDCTVASTPH